MFTSQDLYDWMIGKLSATYFQSYRLAYKLCQQAERCYRYELGSRQLIRAVRLLGQPQEGAPAGETLNTTSGVCRPPTSSRTPGGSRSAVTSHSPCSTRRRC